MNGAVIESSSQLAVPPSVWDIRAVADFNGDSRADLMWRNTSTGENVVWLMLNLAIRESGYLRRVPDPAWNWSARDDVKL